MVKSATRLEPLKAVDLRFTRDRLAVLLDDDREVTLPLSWYPTLAAASRAKRSDWRLIGRGIGIHWPHLDLDLSVAALTAGFSERVPAPPHVELRKFAAKRAGQPARRMVPEVINRDRQVSSVEWSVRTTKALKAANVNLLSELAPLSVNELRTRLGLGATSANEVDQILKRHGMRPATVA